MKRWIYCLSLSIGVVVPASAEFQLVDDFDRADMWYHGDGWETLTPGHWKIEERALRRRLENVGDGNPIQSFPWHWSTGGREIEPLSRGRKEGLLPMGMLWRRDWNLSGNYTIRAEFAVKAVSEGDAKGYFGICFGGESLYESGSFRGSKRGASSWMALWEEDGELSIVDHGAGGRKKGNKNPVSPQKVDAPKAGDTATIVLEVSGDEGGKASVTVRLSVGGKHWELQRDAVERALFTDGYFGLACFGDLDFEVTKVEIDRGKNKQAKIALNELHVCYPLGGTLKENDEKWTCKMIAMFRNPGKKVEIRVSDVPKPKSGWAAVPMAGSAKIVDNDFRRYTSAIEVTLPGNPGEKTFYYTVWKDGEDVTADPRPAPENEGYLRKKDYVGRLPKLAAPYRVCTLGGHALNGGGTTLEQSGTYQKNWVHGQPTEGAYKFFEDYDFQIVNWDDDVWYLELMFRPPSTDDAYRIINLTIANQTTRWQMMRHWNLINPGDHDYGMDDVKGPEQILVRQRDDLGQDSEYMRRNFNLVQHLSEGIETRTEDRNPKDWFQWKMPNRDFSIVSCESRLWRDSQDTSLWVKGGWGHVASVNGRTLETRNLLGEEQFAWLQEVIRTDTSPLILVTGINCMHPVFTGFLENPETGEKFHQDDRVAADYAGWAKAGTDRVLELFGERPGLLSVYGDIHLAGTVENKEQRLIESSCGPIGRGGSRGLLTTFGPDMKDIDGRDVKVHMLYHLQYDSPSLRKNEGPPHWNFLEKVFDPTAKDPRMEMRIRNIIDAPGKEPRGGGSIDRLASSTGRLPSSTLPKNLKVLPDADVNFSTLDGKPIRGTRSLSDGTLPVTNLVDVAPGTRVLMTARSGDTVDARVVETVGL
tara:strand:+ start:478 stop:3090 length:2613 start_codon:yes stop_codon:yes gene_type:complete